MARNTATAVAAARPNRAYNGGTTAPAAAAKSATSGLGNATGVDRSNGRGLDKPKGFAKEWDTFKGSKALAPLPAPHTPSPLPWDATAQSEVNNAFTKEQGTLGELKGNWAAREGYYGFGENGADNPYSQAALLATHHEWNERGRSNASGLHAFDGSNVNAAHEEVGRYTTSYEQLLQAYEAEKAAKERQEKTAEDEYEGVAGEGGSAQAGAVGRASETEPEPVAPPAGKGKPPKPQSAPKGKKWAWNGSQWHLVKA